MQTNKQTSKEHPQGRGVLKGARVSAGGSRAASAHVERTESVPLLLFQASQAAYGSETLMDLLLLNKYARQPQSLNARMNKTRFN